MISGKYLNKKNDISIKYVIMVQEQNDTDSDRTGWSYEIIGTYFFDWTLTDEKDMKDGRYDNPGIFFRNH